MHVFTDSRSEPKKALCKKGQRNAMEEKYFTVDVG
jgi:hypothetical protein